MRIQENVGEWGNAGGKRDDSENAGKDEKESRKATKKEKGNPNSPISQKTLGTLSFCKDYGK